MRNPLTIVVGILGGICGALCIVNAALWALPVQDGLFIGDTDPKWPAFHFVPHTRFTHSDGWNLHDVVRGTTNNMGYVAPFDYRFESGGIFVLGDSFVESAMNAYPDSLQGQIKIASIPSTSVLNFGYSGASLSDYLGVAALVGQNFRPDWVVVVVVPGDFVDGFGSEPGFYRWAPQQSLPVERVPDHGTKGRLKKAIRSIALVRYIKGHLGVSLHSLFGYTPVKSASGCVAPHLEPGDVELLRHVAGSFPEAAHVQPSHVIVVFDSDVHPMHDQQLMGGRSLCPTRDGLAREGFAQAAEAAGMHVIQMQPIFAAYVAANHERIDLPDSHWNGAGNRLAARAVTAAIEQAQAPASGTARAVN